MSPTAVANALGVGGLLLIVAAVVVLAGWAWGLLLAGVLLVAVSYLTHRSAAPAVPRAAAASKGPELRRVA